MVSITVATHSLVFGEATWRPANTNWAFTAGLRYTEETKDMTWLWRDAALGGVGGYVAAAIAEAAAQALQGITINIPRDLTSGLRMVHWMS